MEIGKKQGKLLLGQRRRGSSPDIDGRKGIRRYGKVFDLLFHPCKVKTMVEKAGINFCKIAVRAEGVAEGDVEVERSNLLPLTGGGYAGRLHPVGAGSA